MPTNDSETARQTLLSFFSKMNEWEVQGVAIKDSASDWPIILGKQLEAIYSEFLTFKKRDYGRLIWKDSLPICSSIGSPPEYDCLHETIQGFLEGKQTAIETLRTNPAMPALSFKLRYYFKMEEGKCRIDRKEKYSALKEKWIKESF